MYNGVKNLFVGLIMMCLCYNVAAQSSTSITFSVSPANSGTSYPSGLHYFHPNQVYTIGATANSGYQFSHWQISGSSYLLTDVTNPNGMVKTRPGNSYFVAVFTGNQGSSILTMVSEPDTAGTLTPTAGTHTVNNDDAISISATAASGYSFSYWEVTGNATIHDANASSTYVKLKSDATVTAHFVADQTATLTMAVLPDASGTTTPAAGMHSVSKNTPIYITATAADGCQLNRFSRIN